MTTPKTPQAAEKEKIQTQPKRVPKIEPQPKVVKKSKTELSDPLQVKPYEKSMHSSGYQDGYKAYMESDFIEAAIKWREAGDAESLFGLATIYWYGLELSENVTVALKLYEKSANLGSVNAQFLLANTYWEGNKVDVNKAKAIDYYKIAANNGHVNSQLLLGIWYESGEGFEKDPWEAVRWYEKAKSNDNIYAHYALGELYTTGKLPKNIVYAEELYKTAASDGHAPSFFKLGVMNGARGDFLAAHVLVSLASRLGDKNAIELKINVFDSLTKKEQRVASSLINSCIKNEYKGCSVLVYENSLSGARVQKRPNYSIQGSTSANNSLSNSLGY